MFFGVSWKRDRAGKYAPWKQPPPTHPTYAPPGSRLNKAEASHRGRWTMSAACRVL